MSTTTQDDQLFGAQHVACYRETGGEHGHDWHGTSTLLLTTTGRKSGQKRTTPLIYQPYGDAYLVVASKGGARAARLVPQPAGAPARRGAGARRRLPRPRPHRDARGEAGHVANHDGGVAGLRRIPAQDRPRDPGRRPRTAA